MVEPDVVLAKISVIQRCLKRIAEVTRGDPESLNEIDVQDICVLNLQRAVQAAVDLAAHVVSSEGWGVPESLKAAFEILGDNRVLDRELTRNLKSMVGFRNIAVHDYRSIDVGVLKEILLERLIDLERFYRRVVEHFDITGTDYES